uniref:Uncharacterized protein n=1 Tax=Pararge aegeria TaxID=116150 RepID=S4P8Z8_9NEOP
MPNATVVVCSINNSQKAKVNHSSFRAFCSQFFYIHTITLPDTYFNYIISCNFTPMEPVFRTKQYFILNNDGVSWQPKSFISIYS